MAVYHCWWSWWNYLSLLKLAGIIFCECDRLWKVPTVSFNQKWCEWHDHDVKIKAMTVKSIHSLEIVISRPFFIVYFKILKYTQFSFYMNYFKKKTTFKQILYFENYLFPCSWLAFGCGMGNAHRRIWLFNFVKWNCEGICITNLISPIHFILSMLSC